MHPPPGDATGSGYWGSHPGVVPSFWGAHGMVVLAMGAGWEPLRTGGCRDAARCTEGLQTLLLPTVPLSSCLQRESKLHRAHSPLAGTPAHLLPALPDPAPCLPPSPCSPRLPMPLIPSHAIGAAGAKSRVAPIGSEDAADSPNSLLFSALNNPLGTNADEGSLEGE